ncbi:MAG: type II toxin-antitoxin system VapC family toxin [Gemmatimonadota bacterium]
MIVTRRASETTRGSVVVVDASALAALLFGEPDARDVATALEGHDLSAPSLLRYELASVYLKKVRRYAARRSALTSMLRAYPLLAIDEVQPAADDIARLAEDTDSTAYDAAYLWLAQLLGAPIVTLDRRLAEAARSLGLP